MGQKAALVAPLVPEGRGRFLGACLFGIAGGTDFFGINSDFCFDVNRVLAPDKGLCSDTFLSLPLEPGFPLYQHLHRIVETILESV